MLLGAIKKKLRRPAGESSHTTDLAKIANSN